MATLRELKPFVNLPPGRFIRDRLEERNWTQEELATVLGITPKHLGQVMSGEKALTYDLAQKLGATFDTSAQFWTNLYLSYLHWAEEENEALQETEVRSLIHSRMPIRDMVKKGWLPKTKSVAELKKKVLAFWGKVKLDFSFIDEKIQPCLNRKSEAYNQFNASYAATWYHKARMEAAQHKVSRYNPQKLVTLVERIHTYTGQEKGIVHFLEELEACGVKFFVLPHLEKTYLDGAAFMDGKNPVVIYTGRYKRIDNFWFTVAHEIAHVLKHLGPDCPFILDNLKDGHVDELEMEANRLASEWLKYPEAVSWVQSNRGAYVSSSLVNDCAVEYGIHPALVIGALAHEKEVGYNRLHQFNGDVLKLIPAKWKV